MPTVQTMLTDAQHQVEWLLWLIDRLAQDTVIELPADVVGPDEDPRPPMGGFPCDGFENPRLLRILTFRQLGEAARGNIERSLAQLRS